MSKEKLTDSWLLSVYCDNLFRSDITSVVSSAAKIVEMMHDNLDTSKSSTTINIQQSITRKSSAANLATGNSTVSGSFETEDKKTFINYDKRNKYYAGRFELSKMLTGKNCYLIDVKTHMDILPKIREVHYSVKDNNILIEEIIEITLEEGRLGRFVSKLISIFTSSKAEIRTHHRKTVWDKFGEEEE